MSSVALHGFGGGGGASLNFKVVGNPQPASPIDNTIWISTDKKISNYIFSASEPENPSEGMVWISTGTSSTVAFSATKKNSIMIYPIAAKQYIDGAWVTKTAKSYQDGAWVEWIANTYIVKDGIAEIEFGEELRDVEITVTQGSGYIQYTTLHSYVNGISTKNKIDVTKYRTITLDCDVVSVEDYVAVGIFSSVKASSAANTLNNMVSKKTTKATGRQTIECDIESYSGEYYVGVLSNHTSTSGGSSTVRIYNLWLS